MNRLLKLTQTEDRKVYVTSDFHLNHNPKWDIPIWKMRGFNSVIEMNNSIIESVNGNVRSNDVLFFLGDFCLNTNESQFEEFLSLIVCQNIYCLWGNHNSQVWSRYETELVKLFDLCNIHNPNEPFPTEIYPLRYRNLVFLGNYQEVSIDGCVFILSHFPIHSWNHMKHGSIHCYGHQHCKNNPQGGRQMDVGWDRDKRPYSIGEIVEKVKNVPIVSDGGHH